MLFHFAFVCLDEIYTPPFYQAKLDLDGYGLLKSIPLSYFAGLGCLTIAASLLWVSKEKSPGLLTVQLLILIVSLHLIPYLIESTAGMEATVVNVNGQPKIQVTNIDMGKLPIPQAVKDQLKNLIPENGVIDTANLPFNMEDVQIVDGQMVIKGVTK